MWREHPGQLIGVATGVISGIDVLDIDSRRGGDKWFHQHRDRLPVTRTHETRNGLCHLIFRHTPGLPNTTDRIAPGVMVGMSSGGLSMVTECCVMGPSQCFQGGCLMSW
jgi:hypothetical protein